MARSRVDGRGAGAMTLTLALLGACAPSSPDDAASDGITLDERVRDASSGPSFVERVGDGFVAVAGNIAVPGRIPADPIARADWFLDEYGEEVGVESPMDDVVVDRVVDGGPGREHDRLVVYQRVHDGVPVFGSEIRVEVSGDGSVLAMLATNPMGLEGLSTTPTLAESDARLAAEAELPDAEVLATGLVIVDQSLFVEGAPTSVLAYRIDTRQPAVPAAETVFVDAHDGTLLMMRYDEMHESRSRGGYDCGGERDTKTCSETAEKVYDEGGPLVVSPDSNADSAYLHSGTVYDYMARTFDHEGHDGADAETNSYVHLGGTRPNAFYWEDALWFTEDMVSLDVMAHEFIHGVVHHSAGLVYQGESGAMNESMADVFGWFIDHDDDTIGENTILGVLRDLSDPSAQGNPRHVDEMRTYPAGTTPSKSNDRLGVHTNSSVPNHAAYLAVRGGTHTTSGISVEGIGKSAAEQIYYRALTRYMAPSSGFQLTRVALRTAALLMAREGDHDVSFEDCGSILVAYAAVGVGETDSDLDCFSDELDVCPNHFDPDQDPEVCAESPEPEPDPEPDPDPTEEVCENQGGPCAGSGAAFDDRCCGDLICVVGACQPAVRPREQEACDEGYCARGLSCRRVGSVDAEPTCCARDEDYCEVKDDCCGLQDCVANRCVGRTSGESCMSGDCIGSSYCDSGTCS